MLRITFILSICLFHIIISPFSICKICSRNKSSVPLTLVPFEESKRLTVSSDESELLSSPPSSMLAWDLLSVPQAVRWSEAWRRIPELLESSPTFMLAPKALMIQWLAASPISFHALCPAALKCQPNWASFNSPNAPRLSSYQGCCTCSASLLCEHILPWSFHYILCLKSIPKCIAWREAFLDCPV